MANFKRLLRVYIICCIAFFLGCASNTFTQQGKVSNEEICYEDVCFITIYWEDGSYSSVEERFIPDTPQVFRYCFYDQEQVLVCDTQITDAPIRLFDKRQKDVERQLKN